MLVTVDTMTLQHRNTSCVFGMQWMAAQPCAAVPGEFQTRNRVCGPL